MFNPEDTAFLRKQSKINKVFMYVGIGHLLSCIVLVALFTFQFSEVERVLSISAKVSGQMEPGYGLIKPTTNLEQELIKENFRLRKVFLNTSILLIFLISLLFVCIIFTSGISMLSFYWRTQKLFQCLKKYFIPQ